MLAGTQMASMTKSTPDKDHPAGLKCRTIPFWVRRRRDGLFISGVEADVSQLF
jgi:hypothetical protein